MTEQADPSSASAVILPEGTPNFGAHLRRLQKNNPGDYFQTEAGRQPGLFLREKLWCFIGVVNPRVALGLGVFNLGYMAGGIGWAYDRERDQLSNFNPLALPFVQTKCERDSDESVAAVRLPHGLIRMTNRVRSAGKRFLEARLTWPGESFQATIIIDDQPSTHDPLFAVCPFKEGHFSFTHKMAGLPAEGKIQMPGGEFILDKGDTFALIDWTDGFHPRRTFWNWACAAGISREGRRIGVNLSAGVYTAGVSENVIWVEGRPVAVGEAAFTYDARRPSEAWKVTTADGKVDLTFQPLCERRANQNLGLISSQFIQPYGLYSGRVTGPDGTVYRLEEAGGIIEEHYAKW
jgi:hypothetical protein